LKQVEFNFVSHPLIFIYVFAKDVDAQSRDQDALKLYQHRRLQFAYVNRAIFFEGILRKPLMQQILLHALHFVKSPSHKENSLISPSYELRSILEYKEVLFGQISSALVYRNQTNP